MFAHSIQNFSDTLSALNDFVSIIGPVLDQNVAEILTNKSRDLIPLAFVLGSSGSPVDVPITTENAAVLKEKFGGEFMVEQLESGRCRLEFSGEAGERFSSALKSVQVGTQHKSLLYRSALISLVSAAEWFLSQVVREYFTRYPDAAGIKDKTLSFKELTTLGNVDEARQHLINLRIDEIMWGGLDDWLKFFSGTVKLSMEYLSAQKDMLQEVFQRRNVVIHNNGIVHSSYMVKVASHLRDGIVLGRELAISPVYLQSAIDTVELSFLLIAAELWKQLDPKSKERGRVLIKRAFNSLKSENWRLAEALSYFTMQDKQIPERDQLIGRINYWQALKWQGRFAEVRNEVEQADFTAKDETYQVARQTLLDKFDDVVGSIPCLLKAEKLSRKQLEEWPIFRELRKSQVFDRLHNADEGSRSDAEQIGCSSPTIQ